MKCFNLIVTSLLYACGFVCAMLHNEDVLSFSVAVSILFGLGIVGGFIAFIQVYNYKKWWDYNPAKYWFVHGIIASTLFFLGLFFLVLDFPQSTRTLTLLTPLPLIVTPFGMFIGMLINKDARDL